MSTKDIRYPILSGNAPRSILGKLGFTEDETNEFRRCPEVDCSRTDELFGIIAHLNNDHKFTLPVIGKLIPAIRNNTRKPLNMVLRIQRLFRN